MKIHHASDLHLEFGDIKLAGGDVLLLAGDTWTAAHMNPQRNDERAKSLRKIYEKFCKKELAKYEHVLMVAGNHEFYGGEIETAIPMIGEFLAENAPNATILDGGRVDIGDVAFLGCTLWAPYGASSPITRLSIAYGMNDFSMISSAEGCWKFSPEDAEELHRRDVAWLTEASDCVEGDCIVVTHHAPSLRCDAVKGGLSDAYFSNQEPLIHANPKIKAWVFGHTHQAFAETIGETLVVSNQRGYKGYTEAKGFKVRELDVSF